MNHALRNQEMSTSSIARRAGLNRRIAGTHLAVGLPDPACWPRPFRLRLLEHFEDYMLSMLG